MKTLQLLCIVLCLGYFASAKILGERSPTNFPMPWQLGEKTLDSESVTFIIALKQTNLDVLESTYWSVVTPGSPQYRNFMSPKEILDIVKPTVETVYSVYSWLMRNGVSRSQIEDNVDALIVRTSVGVASVLFNTSFYTFHHPHSGKQIIRQMGEFSVPEMVEDHIELVSGLSEFPVPHYSVKKSPLSRVTVAPQSLFTLYKIPDGTKITGNSSAGVIEWDNQYYDPAQLQTFAKQFAVNVNTPSADHTVGFNLPSSPQVEATLDIQYVLSTGINAESWFWIEQSGVWLYGWAVHFFSVPVVPYVASISYGWNEEDQCQVGIGSNECQQLGVDSKGYVSRVNIEFQKIGLRGVSILSASGDSGANGRTDPYCSEDHLNPPYPGASPFITAVGATQITDASGQSSLPNPPPGCAGQNCASGGDETCVSFDQASFASGGGFSVVAAQPSYQTAAVTAYLNSGVALPPASYFNAAGRGFPDVSALGSQILIFDGQLETVGGTSASCPIWAGVIALVNDYVITKTGKPLGPLNPFLYKMAADHPSAFTDITVGDNICTEGGCSANCKGYRATKGWDPVSGLGTPVFTEIISYASTLFDIKE
jgi:tripeptidyl-peptidase-1